MALRTLDSFDLKGKNVLIRVDMNVPMKNGLVTDATRLSRAVPTIWKCWKKAASQFCCHISGVQRVGSI